MTGLWELDKRPTSYRFRRSANRWFLAACSGVFALAGFSGIGESNYDDGYYAADSAFATGSRIFYGLIGVGAAIVMVRVLRMGLIAGPRRLIVRNLVKRHSLQWDDIESFCRPAPYGQLRRSGLQIVLRSGEVIYCSLYSAGPLNRPSVADEVIEKLETLRSEFTGREFPG